MREGLRRELLDAEGDHPRGVRQVTVTDQEIIDFFNANKAQFNLPEEAYHLAQIVITPGPDPQLANGTGDDATTPQAAAQKVQMLMERLKAGAVVQRAGRRLFRRSRRRRRAAAIWVWCRCRACSRRRRSSNAVLGKNPGAVNVAASNGAYTLVLVVSHEQAGQRDLNTPGMKDNLTQLAQGAQGAGAARRVLTAARNDAKVEHYLARRLVEAKGVVAGGQPVTPAAAAASK